ncbi:MAG: RluA family pseudouridine synthase [Candidatus Pelagibacter sp.]
MKNIINLIVNENEINQRIDIYISHKERKLSRTKIKKLIINKNLKINNILIQDPSKKISKGDYVVLQIPEIKKESIKPFDYNLNIEFEDDDIIVINKSSGISIHPGPGNYENTIVNALMNLKGRKYSNIGGELRPGIVHRIDKDTSGLIVVAKNNYAHEELSKQFSKHSITRVYQALIWGKLRPQKGKIETLIKRSSRNRQLMEVGISKGKKAVTNYKTLEVFENDKVPTFSFVECNLETGRTHQIRVHMSYKLNNIVGDQKYKKKFKKIRYIDENLKNLILNLDRQFLHAKKLGFIHPKSQKYIEFESKLPRELENILKKLRKTVK